MSKSKRKSPQDWRQDVVNGLMINGKAKRTAETYAREVRIFCKWLPIVCKPGSISTPSNNISGTPPFRPPFAICTAPPSHKRITTRSSTN